MSKSTATEPEDALQIRLIDQFKTLTNLTVPDIKRTIEDRGARWNLTVPHNHP